MEQDSYARVAILCSGNREARRNTTAENSRFSDLFSAFTARRIYVEPAIYHDDFCEDVREQLMRVDGVLVWVNPIEGGRDRSVLDSMLRDVAGAGVFVSTHPDVILKLWTKEVLYCTRNLEWASDTHLYSTMDQMIQELPLRLATAKARVLKQHRGNGGNGVFKIDATGYNDNRIVVTHAKGNEERALTIDDLFAEFEPYFTGNDMLIDQEWNQNISAVLHGESNCQPGQEGNRIDQRSHRF